MEDDQKLRNLFDAAKRGDTDAFERIYNEYYTPIFRYLYVRTFDAEQATDLTQEVFIKVYRSLGSFQLTDSSPLAYMYTIARNTLIDFRRKKRPLVAGDETLLDTIADTHSSVASTTAQAHAQETSKMLRIYLQELSDDQREIVVLSYISMLPTAEVARIVEKSEVAVRQALSRALRRLAQIIPKDYGTQ